MSVVVHAFTFDATRATIVSTLIWHLDTRTFLNVSDEKSSILSGQISGSDTDINSIYVELHTEVSPRTTARITALDEDAAKEGGGR